MRTTVSDKKRYILYSLIALCAVVLVVFAVLFLNWWENKNGEYTAPPPKEPETEARFDDGYERKTASEVNAFLFIGYNSSDEQISGEYRNNKIADLLMLFVFDKKAKTFTVLQIDKDTVAKMNVIGEFGTVIGETTEQIAMSHTYGADSEPNKSDAKKSAQNVANAVSKLLLGIDINVYISMSIDSISKYNDEKLGGVEVEVLDDFTGVDSSLVKGEKITLLGDKMLNYVKYHKEMQNGTNSSLMARQFQYIEAMNKKGALLQSQNPDFLAISGLFMIDYVTSNKRPTQLWSYMEDFSKYEFAEKITLAGEYKNEENLEFYPSDEAVKKFVLSNFYKPKQ